MHSRMSLWTESDKIFVRVGKSEATEVQFAKRCDPNEMDELIFELTITVNVGAEAVGNWIYEALLDKLSALPYDETSLIIMIETC